MFRKLFPYKWREYRVRELRRKSEDKREKIREKSQIMKRFIISTFHQIPLVIPGRKSWTSMKEMRYAYRILVGKLEGTKLFWRHR
jgi:hypothetical protein